VGAGVEDAEEVVQDAFVSAVEAARDFRGQCSIKTWLCGIAKVRTVDYMRAKGRAKRIPSEKLVRLDELSLQGIRAVYAPEVSLEDLVDQLDRVRLVQSLLDSLSPDQREALVLHHIEGFSVPETARLMKRSPKAVEKLLERAKEKPRQEIMRWLGEESFRMICLGLVVL
jgi:RNA polymerase sigma-70 factor (ECF subfamily)